MCNSAREMPWQKRKPRRETTCMKCFLLRIAVPYYYDRGAAIILNKPTQLLHALVSLSEVICSASFLCYIIRAVVLSES